MYIGTLTLSLFLAVFGAVLLAVVLGNQIARPLLLLADGVRQVAAGDLTPKAALQGKDELGGLTRSFADMTQQLADARSAVDKQHGAGRRGARQPADHPGQPDRRRDRARRAGRDPVVQPRRHAHPAHAAGRLRRPAAGRQCRAGRVWRSSVQAAVRRLSGRARPSTGWTTGSSPSSCNAARPAAVSRRTPITLVARGAELPGNARLLVFDDISEIVSAQRAQAWGEVARRLAHEIKNPLTPIQLSAERLEMKLTGKVGRPSRPC